MMNGQSIHQSEKMSTLEMKENKSAPLGIIFIIFFQADPIPTGLQILLRNMGFIFIPAFNYLTIMVILLMGTSQSIANTCMMYI